MTGSSVAGIITASTTFVTAASLWFAAYPAFVKMRREQRQDRAATLAAQIAAAEAQVKIAAKIDIVHTLTNATLSVAKQAEVDAKKRELMMMREVGALHAEAGRQPSPEWVTAIDNLEHEIARLELEVMERAESTRAANVQIDTEAAREART